MRPKEKFILGTFITIAGGTLLITSLVFGIISITSGLYEDVYTYPVLLSVKNQQDIAGTFSAQEDQILSFWLKVPDRRIENKNFKLSINIEGYITHSQKSWQSDFTFGYLRNSSGQGQYYQLGTHRFSKDFYGSLSYTAHGKWVAPYNAYLVVRKIKSLQWPKIQTLFFALGFLVLLLGINIIGRYMKCLCEEK